MKNIMFAFIIIFIVIISTTVLFASSSSNSSKNELQIVRYESVLINEGDCLSTICEKYNTSLMSTSAFTKYVKSFNNLKNDTIYYGDSILVPIFAK